MSSETRYIANFPASLEAAFLSTFWRIANRLKTSSKVERNQGEKTIACCANPMVPRRVCKYSVTLQLWESLVWIIYVSQGVIPLTITSMRDCEVTCLCVPALFHPRSSRAERKDFKHKVRRSQTLLHCVECHL